MPKIDAKKLLKAAAAATRKSYAPYSRFAVGAALLCSDGTLVTGCNVENSSYGLTNCAERTALFTAVAAGKKGVCAVAVVGKGDRMPYPCGACRQVLSEFCNPNMPVFMARFNRLTRFETTTLGTLLPKAFDLGAT